MKIKIVFLVFVGILFCDKNSISTQCLSKDEELLLISFVDTLNQSQCSNWLPYTDSSDIKILMLENTSRRIWNLKKGIKLIGEYQEKEVKTGAFLVLETMQIDINRASIELISYPSERHFRCKYYLENNNWVCREISCFVS
jgi:hypothetical protein